MPQKIIKKAFLEPKLLIFERCSCVLNKLPQFLSYMTAQGAHRAKQVFADEPKGRDIDKLCQAYLIGLCS